MLDSIKQSPLFKIINPGSIAVFGASNSATTMGSTLLDSIKTLGFEGALYPIHPKEQEVQGLKAYSNIGDVPETPDVALLVLPTRLVSETLDACGKKGIRHAIVVSGGFNEVGGDGIRLQKELEAVAGKHRIRFLGPNCIGVTNPHHKLNTTFMPFAGKPGFVGMASQSGSFVTQMFDYLDELGMGFSSAFSVGNEANLDIVDCLEYLGACPNTKVIALYIEGIKRGRAFIETARSIAPHKPIVAIYVSGSEAGSRAGFSHTGSLAGPDPLYDGAFRQSGIVRARSVTELFDFCSTLGRLPLPEGPNIVIQTHSGGPGAVAADACSRAGLQVPPLSPDTLKRLSAYVPHTGSINNPVDLTFMKNPLYYYNEIPEVLISEEKADIMLMYLLISDQSIERALTLMGIPKEQIEKEADKFIRHVCNRVAELAEKQKKPLVGYTFRNLGEKFCRVLIERGVPLYPGPERAVPAIKALLTYKRLREKILSGNARSGA